MNDIHISHISESKFEKVCKEIIKAYPNLSYMPADWEWSAYPDIGYATIHDHNGTFITWGSSRYKAMPDHSLQSEDIIRVSTPENLYGSEIIIDTVAELRNLIFYIFRL